jgi:hypothetical protein
MRIMGARSGPPRTALGDGTLDRGFWHLGGRLGGRVVRRRPARGHRLSRAALYEEAQRLGIRRRSRMKKAELAEAIHAARVAWWSRGFVALLSFLASAYRGLGSLWAAVPRLQRGLLHLRRNTGRETPRRLPRRRELSRWELELFEEARRLVLTAGSSRGRRDSPHGVRATTAESAAKGSSSALSRSGSGERHVHDGPDDHGEEAPLFPR